MNRYPHIVAALGPLPHGVHSPKVRALSWLLNFIENIYDAKLIQELTILTTMNPGTRPLLEAHTRIFKGRNPNIGDARALLHAHRSCTPVSPMLYVRMSLLYVRRHVQIHGVHAVLGR